MNIISTTKLTSKELATKMTSFQNDLDEVSNDNAVTDLFGECDLGQVELASVQGLAGRRTGSGGPSCCGW